MQKLTILACLAFSSALPVASAESVRFPALTPDKFSPQQKEFADLLQKKPAQRQHQQSPVQSLFPQSRIRAARHRHV